MPKVLTSSYPAKAAIGAMVGEFFGRHPQVANVTVVFPKLNPTLFTLISGIAKTKGNKSEMIQII
eukprot:scaffold7763_cov245-Amphora_coffeaeformis.AAC.2